MRTQRLPQASRVLDTIRKFPKDATTHGVALLSGHRENVFCFLWIVIYHV